jgi:hypothetical protein
MGGSKMSTRIKVGFSEASKWVTSQTEFMSDELSIDEVVAKAAELAHKAQSEAAGMTMRKGR